MNNNREWCNNRYAIGLDITTVSFAKKKVFNVIEIVFAFHSFTLLFSNLTNAFCGYDCVASMNVLKLVRSPWRVILNHFSIPVSLPLLLPSLLHANFTTTFGATFTATFSARKFYCHCNYTSFTASFIASFSVSFCGMWLSIVDTKIVVRFPFFVLLTASFFYM